MPGGSSLTLRNASCIASCARSSDPSRRELIASRCSARETTLSETRRLALSHRMRPRACRTALPRAAPAARSRAAADPPARGPRACQPRHAQGLVARAGRCGDPVHLADARIAVEPQLYQRAVAAGRVPAAQAGGMGGVAQAWLPRTRRPRSATRVNSTRWHSGSTGATRPAACAAHLPAHIGRPGRRLPTLGQTAVDQHGHAAGPAIGDQRLAQQLGRYGKRDQDGRRFRPREDGRPAQGQRQAGAARALSTGRRNGPSSPRKDRGMDRHRLGGARRRHRKAAMLGR